MISAITKKKKKMAHELNPEILHWKPGDILHGYLFCGEFMSIKQNGICYIRDCSMGNIVKIMCNKLTNVTQEERELKKETGELEKESSEVSNSYYSEFIKEFNKQMESSK